MTTDRPPTFSVPVKKRGRKSLWPYPAYTRLFSFVFRLVSGGIASARGFRRPRVSGGSVQSNQLSNSVVPEIGPSFASLT